MNTPITQRDVEYRYIMYASQKGPWDTFPRLTRHPSLQSAREEFEDFCVVMHTNECSARLHRYSEEDWEEALEFKNTGCPFDYPDLIIEWTPSGFITINPAE